jgi:hypothetical protein
MSGGSLDYASSRIEDLASAVRGRATTPLHRAFATHLDKVALAAHDLEWMLSGDTSPGDEVAAIEACLQPGAVLAQVMAEAEVVLAALRDELMKVRA